MVAASEKLERLTERYVLARNRQIRLLFGRINRLCRECQGRLQNVLLASYGARRTILEDTDRILRRLPVALSGVLEEGLADIWHWGWRRATENWVRAVPMGYWVQRLRPLADLRRGYREQEELSFDPDIEVQRVVDGLATQEEAREIVRQIEFPPPSERQVERILDATNAPDGKSAMQRIKTIARSDLPQVRRAVVAAMSEVDGASAVKHLSGNLRQFFAPGAGVNYKARRIARTEGVRVAQAAQDEAREEVADLLKGIEVFTMEDVNVRPEHRSRFWPAKLYLRIGANSYRARDGESYNPPPFGPNCRCSSRDVLDDDLVEGAPPVKYSPGYGTSQARFRRQQKAMEKP